MSKPEGEMTKPRPFTDTARRISLQPWQEAVGKITGLDINDDQLDIILSIEPKDMHLRIPIDGLKAPDGCFQHLVGLVVSILKTDSETRIALLD